MWLLTVLTLDNITITIWKYTHPAVIKKLEYLLETYFLENIAYKVRLRQIKTNVDHVH